MDNLEFIQSLYDNAEQEIEKIHEEQENNKDELLREIARLLLVYTIVNEVITDVPKSEKKALISMIVKAIKKECKLSETTITKLLHETSQNVFEYYSYNASLKVTKDIVFKELDGKTFSDRIWGNGEDIAKKLETKLNKFINGEINVNKIKKEIEKTYKTNKYNIDRLVDNEVSRVQNQSFMKFAEETGVKTLIRNEILDSKTCEKCYSHDGDVWGIDDPNRPELPVHVLCRGFWTVKQ